MSSKQKQFVMKTGIGLTTIVLALAIWWVAATPPAHLAVQPAFEMGPVPNSITQVNAKGDPLSEELLTEFKNLPGHDEIILQEDLGRAFVTCMDGWIWILDLENKTAKRFVDAPLMATGARQVRGNPDKIIFCSSYLYGAAYPADEKVGIYELTISDKTIRPLVLRAPNLPAEMDTPKGNQGLVYRDQGSVRLRLDRMTDNNSRPLKFCNDLDISKDGTRVYFSEPFAYEGASMGGGVVGEAITLGRNGILWRLDTKKQTIDCVGRGYSFVDGVLLENDQVGKETAVLISETIRFRILRLYLSGNRAGQDEIVHEDLPGMPDGLDRDTEGRIWVGMLKKRSPLINWIHKNPWVKPFILRLPQSWLPSGEDTGIIAFSEDCQTPLYCTMHDGRAINNISVVVAGQNNLYFPCFNNTSRGLYSMVNPFN